MIFSEHRYPLFQIMLLFEHDLFGKPVSTFPDHALALVDGNDAPAIGQAVYPGERERIDYEPQGIPGLKIERDREHPRWIRTVRAAGYSFEP